MARKLVILSGADRVGKSTLVEKLRLEVGPSNCLVYHHGIPDQDPDRIFDTYRDHIDEWLEDPNREWCFFDRAYPCSFALEEFRRRNNGHLDDIVDMELELMPRFEEFRTIHVVVRETWRNVAHLHLEELRAILPDSKPWRIRDEYVMRMKEHKLYYEKMDEFSDNVTAFPVVDYYRGFPVKHLVNTLEGFA